MMSKNNFSYHLRYYEYSMGWVPPLLSFMIIDLDEVIFAFYRDPYMPIEGEVRLAVKNRKIVNLFQDYYNTIWHGAKVLKNGDTIESALLQEIRERLELQGVE